jgi:hypothetical protein
MQSYNSTLNPSCNFDFSLELASVVGGTALAIERTVEFVVTCVA